jgi:hypothetical protein
MAKEKTTKKETAPAEANAADAPKAASAPKVSSKPPKIPKLQKKHKTGLPRRQKKAAQKAGIAAQRSR